MTAKRTIREVLNCRTGEEIDADQFFLQPPDEIIVYRSELQKSIERISQPLFVCYYCNQLIRIRGGKNNGTKRKIETLHFAHLKDSEDCPIKTANPYSKEEIDRIKYNRTKESQLHIDTKEKLRECLSLNEKRIGQVQNIQVETVIKGAGPNKEWKKPDLNFEFNGRRIAIDLQLSTTWLDIVTRRQEFYKNQEIFILWIFHHFDLNDNTRRLMFSDVLYTNNQNAYVFDEEAYQKSVDTGNLVLKCFYKKYGVKDFTLTESWPPWQFITLSDLTFQEENSSIYFHDSYNEKELCNEEIRVKFAILAKDKEQVRKEHYAIKTGFWKISTERKEMANEINNLNSLVATAQRSAKLKEERLEECNRHLQYLAQYVESICKHLSFPRPKLSFSLPSLGHHIPGYPFSKMSEICGEYEGALREMATSAQELQLSLEVATTRSGKIEDLQKYEPQGQSYWILNPRKAEHRDFLLKNWTQVKIVLKAETHQFFPQIKTIGSEHELNQIHTNPNWYFLFDFTRQHQALETEIDRLKAELQQKKLQQELLINDLSDKVQQFLEAEKINLEKELGEEKLSLSNLEKKLTDSESHWNLIQNRENELRARRTINQSLIRKLGITDID